MTTLTKAKVAQIDADIQAALNLLGEKHGVKFDVKKFRYSSVGGTASIGVEMSSIAESGDVATKEMLALQHVLKTHAFGNLNASTINDTFMIQGNKYRVVGYASRCYAKPFQVQDIRTGKIFKATDEHMRKALLVKAA